jgi:hypothetical protein
MTVSFLRAARLRGVVGNRTPAPPYLKVGGRVLYELADLDEWLDDRKVHPGKAAARRKVGS